MSQFGRSAPRRLGVSVATTSSEERRSVQRDSPRSREGLGERRDFLGASRVVVDSIPRMVAIEVPEARGPTSREGGEEGCSHTHFLSLLLSLSISASPRPSFAVHSVYHRLCPSRQKRGAYIKIQSISTRENYLRLSRENKPRTEQRKRIVVSRTTRILYIHK